MEIACGLDRSAHYDPAGTMSVLESLLQKMLDKTDDLVVVVDEQGCFQWVNEGAVRFYGGTRAQLQGRSAFEFIHPEDLEVVQERFATWIEATEGETDQVDCRLVGAGGRIRLVAWTAMRHPGPAGTEVFTCQGRDITAKRQAAARVAESEARLRTVLTGLLDGVVTVGLDGIIRDASPSMEGLYGWKPEELVGRNVNVLIPEPHHSSHDNYLAKYRATGETWILGSVREFVVHDRHGRPFDLELAVSRVDVEATGETLLCGVFRDATQRKEAERALAESERRFRGVFDQEHQLVLLVGPDGVVREANQAALELAGSGTLLGSPLWEAGWWARAERYQEQVEGWLEAAWSGGLVKSELELLAPDGDLHTMDFSLKAIQPGTTDGALFLVELRDVTEARRAQHRERSMLRALATIGESASILAHEVKNPITSINLALRAVAKLMGEDERLALDDLLERLRKLERTMRRTLSFARPLELRRGRVPVAELLQGVCDQLRPEAEDAEVTLELETGPGCPPILGDAGHLEDALVNIVRNAIDALDGRGRVRLTAAPFQGWVQLVIEDDGPGIPLSMRGSLFDPFITSKAEGTGVGLALCRKVVEEHGGSIESGDSPLGGARFAIQLPAATDSSLRPEA